MLTMGFFCRFTLSSWGSFLLALVVEYIYQEGVLNFVKFYFWFTKMIFFLYSILLIWHIKLIDLQMMNQSWISSLKPIWSCVWSFLHVPGFCLVVFLLRNSTAIIIRNMVYSSIFLWYLFLVLYQGNISLTQWIEKDSTFLF